MRCRAGYHFRMTRLLPWKIVVPLVLGVVASIAVLAFAEMSNRRLERGTATVSNSLETRAGVFEILGLVTDSETAQRGFLLTEREAYLEPYVKADERLERTMNRLRAAVVRGGSAEQRDLAGKLFALSGRRLSEIEATLALYRRSGRDTALELLNTDLGKRTMDELRAVAQTLLEREQAAIEAAQRDWSRYIDFSRLGIQVLTVMTLALLIALWALASREIGRREESRRALAETQRRLEHEVGLQTAELSELSAHLQDTTEREKSQLARELHDELGSVLVSAKMDLAWAHDRLAANQPDVAGRLLRAMDALDQGVTVKRRVIENLRPTLLDNLSLAAAIEWHAGDTCQRAGLGCKLDLDDTLELAPDASIALYRIVQESLTNVVKHAKATAVDIRLRAGPAGVTLEIRDDGIGIPEGALRNRLSHGIVGMRQRTRALGGQIEVTGQAGSGTVIAVRLPAALRRQPEPEAEAGRVS